MKSTKRFLLSVLLGMVLSLTLGCQAFDAVNNRAVAATDETPEAAATPEPPPEFVLARGAQIRQWAATAEASSEYAEPEWGAVQVLGAPDTRRCGDYQTAWAPAGSDEISWVEVKFDIPVFVTAVNVIQTFNPNQVVLVELVGDFDQNLEIYNADPVQVDQPCPYTLPIEVEKTTNRYDTVRIYIDQSVLGLGWNEIDAVELVGEAD